MPWINTCGRWYIFPVISFFSSNKILSDLHFFLLPFHPPSLSLLALLDCVSYCGARASVVRPSVFGNRYVHGSRPNSITYLSTMSISRPFSFSFFFKIFNFQIFPTLKNFQLSNILWYICLAFRGRCVETLNLLHFDCFLNTGPYNGAGNFKTLLLLQFSYGQGPYTDQYRALDPISSKFYEGNHGEYRLLHFLAIHKVLEFVAPWSLNMGHNGKILKRWISAKLLPVERSGRTFATQGPTFYICRAFPFEFSLGSLGALCKKFRC